MKKGHVTVLVEREEGYTRYCFPHAEIFAFKSLPTLESGPIELRGGPLFVGDKIVELSGSKKSAGFTSIIMKTGTAMIYRGALRTDKGLALCFLQEKNGEVESIKLPDGEYAVCYWGWHFAECTGDLVYCTNSCAGRVVETEVVRKCAAERLSDGREVNGVAVGLPAEVSSCK